MVCSGVTRPPQRIRWADSVNPPPNAGINTRPPGGTRPCFHGLDQRDRRRGRTHVAVLLHGEKHLVGARARALGDGVDDAQIRLMRHDQCDVVHGHAGAAHHIEAGLAHALHGLAEDFLTVEVPAGLPELHAQVGVHGAHAAHPQDVPRIGVALEFLGDDAALLLG